MEIINTIAQTIIAITSSIICFFAFRGFKLRPTEKLETIQLYHEFKKFYDDVNLRSEISYFINSENKTDITAFRGTYKEYIHKIHEKTQLDLLDNPKDIEIHDKILKLLRLYHEIYVYARNFCLLDKKLAPIYAKDILDLNIAVGDLIIDYKDDFLVSDKDITNGYISLLKIAKEYKDM